MRSVKASMMDYAFASTMPLKGGTAKAIDYLLEVMRGPDERTRHGTRGLSNRLGYCVTYKRTVSIPHDSSTS